MSRPVVIRRGFPTTGSCAIAFVCALGIGMVAMGCRTELVASRMPDLASGPAPTADLASPDLASADLASFDLAGCDPSKTRRPLGQPGPIVVGDSCDEVRFCVVSQQKAEQVKIYAPHFVCSFDPISSSCPYGCTWAGGQIDAAMLEEICVATRLDPIGTVDCMIYVN